ncbi:uncharacterized protein Tco025E_09333 [Trypanosoma conorhini]|uniref:Uncharacterized protein n=1 Tax=Trypanosoma conorhini TaxID=83891 RepID=A0A3R7N0P5_9TRYP|nr:uncharacterized protein Tco025E_09333 [Trypanosoma conorhini]RNE98082.1 hypothetical protein Tco025E_09333 [Trypanosoma conorhini]
MAVKRIRRSPCRDFLGVKCAVSAPPPNPLSRLAHTEGALAGSFQDRGGSKHKSAPWLRNGLCEGTSGHALSCPVLATRRANFGLEGLEAPGPYFGQPLARFLGDLFVLAGPELPLTSNGADGAAGLPEEGAALFL